MVQAALVWLMYVALEPSVRARWPRVLISWNRILIGQWSDPLVGTRVLQGAFTGALIASVFLGNAVWQASRGNLTSSAHDDAGISASAFLADLASLLQNGISFGLAVIFAIFVLRALLRNDWLASVAAAVLMTGVTQREVWISFELISIVFFIAIFGAIAFVLLRLGLVAAIVAITFVDLLLRTPGAQNMTKWYEWTVIAYPLVALAIVAWAFWQASGEEALSSEPKLT